MNAVTQARELYTNGVEDERYDATVDRTTDWVNKISQLVVLNANSSNGLAQSLADAIRNTATQYPVAMISGMNALGQPEGVSQANPFWLALANKADLAADYVTSVNRAKAEYLVGESTTVDSGPYKIMVCAPNGLIGTGMLQHQAELRISQSAAARDYNKATVQAEAQRDRTLASARTNLAAAKGTWKEGLVAQTDANTTSTRAARKEGSIEKPR